MSVSYPAAPGVGPIACPSPSVCYAAGTDSSEGGDVLTTTDAGATWRSDTLPPNVGIITGISCPSVSRCLVAAGVGIVGTGDGGIGWTVLFADTAGATVDAVACPSPSICYAVGQTTSDGRTADAAAIGTTDGGHSWHDFTIPAESVQSGVLTSVACPSTSVCYAIDDDGDYFDTTDGGRTWLGVLPQLEGGYGVGIACPTPARCLTVGETGILLTTDGGVVWTDTPGPTPINGRRPFGLEAVACPSMSVCYATGATGTNDVQGGGEILVTEDGGHSWRVSTTTPWYGGLQGIACPTIGTCFATDDDTRDTPTVAGDVVSTTDGGAMWAAHRLSPGAGQLVDVSCPSATVCFADGGFGILVTTDGGAAWAVRPLPMGSVDPDGLSCPTTLVCYLVASDPSLSARQILGTEDGGYTWRVRATFPLAVAPQAISCPAVDTCVAVGYALLVTTDGGAAWHAATSPDSDTNLTDVACPSITTCYAIGFSDAVVTTDGGRSWRAVVLPSSSGFPSGIACESASSCLIVANVLLCPQLRSDDAACEGAQVDGVDSTADAGRSWLGIPMPTDVNLITAACPSSVVCVAIAYDGQPSSGGVTGQPDDVLVSRSGGTSWATANVPTVTGTLTTMACPTPTTCYVVGQGSGPVGALVLKGTL